MKKTLTKLMAAAGALSVLASAMPFVVSADDATVLPFKYEVKDNGVIITEWTDLTAETATIPATVTVGENDVDVIGVADYAFGLCEDLAVINVPDSLKLDNIGNTAFMTSSILMGFLDNELKGASTTADIVKYVADKAGYKNGNYTDADLADLTVKLNNHLNKVDISAASTVEGKLMTLVKNIGDMGFSQDNLDKFGLWIATVTYDGLELHGNAGIDAETYANGKKIKYVANGGYILGDANGDGKFDVRDAAWVARHLAAGETIDVSTNPAADSNKDGKVTVRDAAAMARALATKN